MTVVQTSPPTRSEVDAVERVLAEAHGHSADGYWRALAEEALESAKDARLREFIDEVDVLTGQAARDDRFDEERRRA